MSVTIVMCCCQRFKHAQHTVHIFTSKNCSLLSTRPLFKWWPWMHSVNLPIHSSLILSLDCRISVMLAPTTPCALLEPTHIQYTISKIWRWRIRHLVSLYKHVNMASILYTRIKIVILEGKVICHRYRNTDVSLGQKIWFHLSSPITKYHIKFVYIVNPVSSHEGLAGRCEISWTAPSVLFTTCLPTPLHILPGWYEERAIPYIPIPEQQFLSTQCHCHSVLWHTGSLFNIFISNDNDISLLHHPLRKSK